MMFEFEMAAKPNIQCLLRMSKSVFFVNKLGECVDPNECQVAMISVEQHLI